jgi:hypothetical protein
LITHRYNKQQKYQDTIRLLHDGAVFLFQHKQVGSGSDLANYMMDTYKLANLRVDEASLGKLFEAKYRERRSFFFFFLLDSNNNDI